MDKIWINTNGFTKLDDEQVKSLDATDLAVYVKDLNKHKIEQTEQKMFDELKNFVSNDDIKSLKEEISALNESNEINLKEKIQDFEIKIQELNDKLNAENEQPINNIKSAIVENHDKIKSLIDGKTNNLSFEVKAAFTRSSVVNNPDYTAIEGVGQLARTFPTIYDLFQKRPFLRGTNGMVGYMDWDLTSVQGADTVAEAGTYPESTAKWIFVKVEARKVGDTQPISEEALYDVDFVESEVRTFIQNNVMNIFNQQLYDGDGVLPNLDGFLNQVNAFNTVGYTGAKTTTPNLGDLIAILRKEIMSGRNAKYNINFALVSWEDYTQYVLEKDTTGQRILKDIARLGVTLVPTSYVAQNELLCGDSRFAYIYEKSGAVEISMERTNDDFITDMYTMRGRKRGLAVIRQADKDGFLKVTDIAAAIVAITA